MNTIRKITGRVSPVAVSKRIIRFVGIFSLSGGLIFATSVAGWGLLCVAIAVAVGIICLREITREEYR